MLFSFYAGCLRHQSGNPKDDWASKLSQASDRLFLGSRWTGEGNLKPMAKEIRQDQMLILKVLISYLPAPVGRFRAATSDRTPRVRAHSSPSPPAPDRDSLDPAVSHPWMMKTGSGLRSDIFHWSCVTPTWRKSFEELVPVIVAVTLVKPGVGVFSSLVKVTMVPAASAAPPSRKLTRSLDHR